MYHRCPLLAHRPKNISDTGRSEHYSQHVANKGEYLLDFRSLFTTVDENKKGMNTCKLISTKNSLGLYVSKNFSCMCWACKERRRRNNSFQVKLPVHPGFVGITNYSVEVKNSGTLEFFCSRCWSLLHAPSPTVGGIIIIIKLMKEVKMSTYWPRSCDLMDLATISVIATDFSLSVLAAR